MTNTTTPAAAFSWADVEKMGDAISRSGMYGTDKKEQGQIIAWHCCATGISPVAWLAQYHLVAGKVSMRADAMLAEFKRLGGSCTWQTALNDTGEARARFVFKENDTTASYTAEDAKREGNAGKALYQKSAPDMLRARLVSKILRMIAPQIVQGAYVPEEIGGDAPHNPAAAPVLFPTFAPITAPAPQTPATSADALDGKTVRRDEETPAALDVGLLGALEKFFTPAETEVNAFLLSKGWIEKGGTFRTLPEKTAKLILSKPESFIERAQKYFKFERS